MFTESLDNESPERIKAILLAKLRILQGTGFINVTAKGNGRFGLTIEQCLGILQNADKRPDFFGIEIKTKTSNNLLTLFSLAPTSYIGCNDKRELITKFGTNDEKKNRLSLFSTFGTDQNNRGFSLSIEDDAIIVKNQGNPILEYNLSNINNSLLAKHQKTAYINLAKTNIEGCEQCKIESVVLCEEPSIENFVKLVASDKIRFELSMYIKDGKLKDYGPFWRIRSEEVPNLYTFSEKVIE
jgi:hypothetical protein